LRLTPGVFLLDNITSIRHIRRMTAEQVKQARENAPFKPFTLFLSDQRKFEIQHPDLLWIIPGGRSIAIAHENGAAEMGVS
jgi:hypothetical protein